MAEQREAAALLSELRAPEEDSMSAQPAPGFYARVMGRVEEERSVPFWEALIEPLFVKRLAFACLMWFFLLGAYVTVFRRRGREYGPCRRADAHAAAVAGVPCPLWG